MRPPFVGWPDDTALAALAGLRARIAVLDRTGMVVWVNASWSRFRQSQSGDTVAAVSLGVNYMAVGRRSRHSAAGAIAEGVRAVVEGGISFFELEYDAIGLQGRRTKLSVTPAPVGQNGAVVTQVDLYGPTETSLAGATTAAFSVISCNASLFLSASWVNAAQRENSGGTGLFLIQVPFA